MNAVEQLRSPGGVVALAYIGLCAVLPVAWILGAETALTVLWAVTLPVGLVGIPFVYGSVGTVGTMLGLSLNNDVVIFYVMPAGAAATAALNLLLLRSLAHVAQRTWARRSRLRRAVVRRTRR